MCAPSGTSSTGVEAAFVHIRSNQIQGAPTPARSASHDDTGVVNLVKRRG
jgi:hypothetical protein